MNFPNLGSEFSKLMSREGWVCACAGDIPPKCVLCGHGYFGKEKELEQERKRILDTYKENG